ncbi:MAG TPA: helix-turn-helix domain-containing protein [archaeon]|nr:helix-turn-helix domain-containing protein [archaeon]
MEISKEEALKDFGLTEKEIKVYLALLRKGQITVNEIAVSTGLNRTSTYDILQNLVERGIASHVIKAGVKYFEAADPQTFLFALDEKREKLNSVIEELQTIRKTITEKPKVEMFEGKEGIKSMMDDIIRTKQPVVAISSKYPISDIISFYMPQFVKNRLKNKIPIKLLSSVKRRYEAWKPNDKKEMRETRFSPKTKDMPNAIYTYGNKVAIFNTRPDAPMGVLIENKDFADSMKILFNIVWEANK